MKKILPAASILLAAFLLITGCEKSFSNRMANETGSSDDNRTEATVSAGTEAENPLPASAQANKDEGGNPANSDENGNPANSDENDDKENKNIQDFNPTGFYKDTMGSDLNIVSDGDDQYTVDYSIYKLTYLEQAKGSFDRSSNILHFEGIDNNGNFLAADLTRQGDHFVVTLTQSSYPDCPNGTVFDFYPADPE